MSSSLSRKILNKLMLPFYKKKSFYGFFEALHSISLKGLEHGYHYGDVLTSGEINVIKLVKKSFKNPVIIDGGANLGQFASKCKEIIGTNLTIYCFEPSQNSYDKLKNKFNNEYNFIIEQKALSDNNSKLTLNHYKNNPEMASIIKCDFPGLDLPIESTETIEAISIDEYCAVNKIERINYLKLDIEGYELTALKGANKMIRNKKIDYIQFEMGRSNIDSKTYFKDFYQLLHKDYKFYRIVSNDLLEINEYSYEMEIFLGSNYLAKLN
ncbi:MAG: FkbM family methyltransferase [Bacteroidia bacterium]